MTEKEKYANEWNNSAEYFSEHNSYKHLAAQISRYKTVLEIGCGTGQSTLALLKEGHSVIALDQNPYCISKAHNLISASQYSIKDSLCELTENSVCFIECDVTDKANVNELLSGANIDIVICWNVGTYWDIEKEEDIFPKMLQYGLTIEQIRQNPESSYGELVIWNSCRIAKDKNCAVQIVDRAVQKLTKVSDPYYVTLKKEFGFKSIKYINMKAKTLSFGGRQLITNGKVNIEREVPIIFTSILLN